MDIPSALHCGRSPF